MNSSPPEFKSTNAQNQTPTLLKQSFKIFVKLLGALITTIAIAYVINALHGHWQQISQQNLQLAILLVIVPGACIYSLSFILIGVAWHHMISRLNPAVTFHVSYWVFSRSHVGKYLPGNILHYVGRQVLGKMCGVPQNLLMVISTSEIFFQFLASAVVINLGSLALPIKFEYRLILFLGTALLFLFLALIIFSHHFHKWITIRSPIYIFIERFQKIGQAKFYLVPFLIYSLHLILVGALISYISYRLGTSALTLSSMLHFSVIYTIAWTLGFITPGAPGGIGIREAMLISQMSSILGTSSSGMVAICLRFAAIIGDVIVFLTSYCVSKPFLRHEV